MEKEVEKGYTTWPSFRSAYSKINPGKTVKQAADAWDIYKAEGGAGEDKKSATRASVKRSISKKSTTRKIATSRKKSPPKPSPPKIVALSSRRKKTAKILPSEPTKAPQSASLFGLPLDVQREIAKRLPKTAIGAMRVVGRGGGAMTAKELERICKEIPSQKEIRDFIIAQLLAEDVRSLRFFAYNREEKKYSVFTISKPHVRKAKQSAPPILELKEEYLDGSAVISPPPTRLQRKQKDLESALIKIQKDYKITAPTTTVDRDNRISVVPFLYNYREILMLRKVCFPKPINPLQTWELARQYLYYISASILGENLDESIFYLLIQEPVGYNVSAKQWITEFLLKERLPLSYPDVLGFNMFHEIFVENSNVRIVGYYALHDIDAIPRLIGSFRRLLVATISKMKETYHATKEEEIEYTKEAIKEIEKKIEIIASIPEKTEKDKRRLDVLQAFLSNLRYRLLPPKTISPPRSEKK